ncbi:LPS translocon maturation chaperone LptM [Congregibacter litoralis]|uniref:LPS translocon maturation chaperone LptM n=1 Tax=Congregibacter litoralis TaxID=393662 RepID=UPI00058EFEFB
MRQVSRTGFIPSSIAIIAAFLALTGCGQMGALYQPQPEEPQTAQLAAQMASSNHGSSLAGPSGSGD